MTHMNTKRRYFYESHKITVVEIRIKSRFLILSDPSGNRPGPKRGWRGPKRGWREREGHLF